MPTDAIRLIDNTFENNTVYISSAKESFQEFAKICEDITNDVWWGAIGTGSKPAEIYVDYDVSVGSINSEEIPTNYSISIDYVLNA